MFSLALSLSAQKIEMKQALVDFFKGLNSIPEIKIDPTISSEYSLYSIENPKPGKLYLGVANYSEVDLDNVTKIVNDLISKNFDSAFQLYDQIKDKIQSPVLDYLIAGEKSLRNFEYEKALEYFTKVIELNPANEYAYYERAKILNSLGRTKDAKKDLIMTFTLNPRFKFYYVRNKYLMNQLKIKIKDRWFIPSWKKTDGSYVAKNELWKYYAQAMLIFKNYSVVDLREITGVGNKDVALRILAIHLMLHYVKLNNLMNDEMKKIEKIIDKNMLPGFIIVEIMPYFYNDFEPLDKIDVENARKYFEEFYIH
jgi:tetratricopeptide (TPR) repeat protein